MRGSKPWAARGAQAASLPVRFAASKLIEGDELILEQLKPDQNEKEMLDHIVLQMEKERGLDRSVPSPIWRRWPST